MLRVPCVPVYVCTCLQYQHRVAEGVEPITFTDGGLVSFKNFLPPRERADEHDERGLG